MIVPTPRATTEDLLQAACAVAAAERPTTALQAVFGAARRCLGATGVALLRAEEDRLTPVACDGLALEPCALNAAPHGAVLYPLALDGRLAGALAVAGPAPEQVSPDDPALRTLCQLAAAALRQVRQASERNQARAFRALHEVAVAASRARDPAALAQLAVDHARELLAVEVASLYSWDPQSQRLCYLASSGSPPAHTLQTVSPTEGIIGQAFQRRAPVVVDDYPTWEHALPGSVERNVRAAAAVPLLVGDQPIAALMVRTSDQRRFTPDEVQLLSLFAAHVAPTLQVARLYAESAERLRTLYQAVACGIVVHSADGEVLDANAAAESMLGLSLAEMRARSSSNRTFWPTVREDDTPLLEAERPWVAVCQTRQPVRGVTVSVVRDDGTRRWLQADAVPVLGPEGEVQQVVSSFIDVTERKEAERRLQELAQADKLRALGQMASGVAHDLNQYLGLITGHGDLALRALERPVPDLESLRDSLGIVVQAAMDGAETVKRLLMFARPRQESAIQPLDVGELLREVAKLTAPQWRDAAQAQGRPISLHVEVEGGLVIDGSPQSLREALTNLVLNAVDALPRGGSIRLAGRGRGEQVEIEIADSGLGMSPDVRAHIFEPFFSTKGERGTGLGLAVVYGIVERHHGQITVDSAPGRGTVFRLTFPAARAAAPDESPAPTARVPTARRILAVDDDPALVQMAAKMLGAQGHTIVSATSGEEALERLAREPFDLVLSDLGLGSGMNGWELAAQVRAHYPGVRFCLATGWGTQIDAAEAAARGVEAVVAKPYRLTDLQRVVAELLPE